MIKIVNLVFILTNDTWKTVLKLTSIIYHLIADDLNKTFASNEDAINVDDVVLEMNDDSNLLNQSNSK